MVVPNNLSPTHLVTIQPVPAQSGPTDLFALLSYFVSKYRLSNEFRNKETGQTSISSSQISARACYNYEIFR